MSIHGDAGAFPVQQQELPDGRVTMYAETGMNIRTYIATEAMKAILSRTDGGIFNPDEVADLACLQAESMLRRMP